MPWPVACNPSLGLIKTVTGVVTVGNAPAASPLPGECGRRRQGGSPPSEGEHFGVNADEPSRRLTACATLVHLNCCFVPSCLAR